MQKLIVGRIIEQAKNCGCGELKDIQGCCLKCKTEVLDVLVIQDIEEIVDGQLVFNEEINGMSFQHAERMVDR